MQRCLEFRTQLLKSGECTFQMEVTADYETELFSFSGSCSCTEDGTRLVLSAPEMLSGIRASLKNDDLQLVFDDVMVALEPLAEDRIAPLAAGGVFYESWKAGELLLAENAEGLLRMTAEYRVKGLPLRVDTWLQTDTLLPVRGQIAAEDTVILTADFTDFRF